MSRTMAPVEEQLAVLLRGADFGDEETRRTMERELRERLEEDRPLRVYCGYDPTAVDLTLGHTISMRKLRQFQDLGHDVTFLIGTFTALVGGDPSDKDKRRPMLSAEQVREHAATYVEQAFRILDRERTTVRENADWLAELRFEDVMRLCSHFTVAQFLERDNFARRWEQHDAIHLSELLYAILQAYDAVSLQADVQVGGSEQLFNLMAGRALQREFDQRPQVVLTLPILVGTDGHKRMSKTTGNYIGVDEAPADIYGKVMSLPDSAMAGYFALLTSLTADEVDALLGGGTAGNALPAMEAKKRLAYEIVASLHPADVAAEAQRYFESTIQRGETPAEMREYSLSGAATSDGGAALHRVLVDAGLVASGAEAKRLVAQGAVSVNDERVADATQALAAGDELRVGRHRFLRIVAGAGGEA
ncbi:MAG: tyrosine--tRNA ligase [Chloroflexi bacterium]|nr:tyrosine--tRNA ligase [Chloroflexota bacterium]